MLQGFSNGNVVDLLLWIKKNWISRRKTCVYVYI